MREKQNAARLSGILQPAIPRAGPTTSSLSSLCVASNSIAAS
jgi:hypothetical protein